jgi:methionine-R-sulfoxide reductase
MMKLLINLLVLTFLTACQAQVEHKNSIIKTKMDSTNFNKLSQQEEYVIVHKGTDRPFTGDYYDKKDEGTYTCRRCNTALYRSSDKFDSHCGWPSFDDEIEGTVIRVPDQDGMRTEIICANCKGHLGHVFLGEGFTKKETRHCVNTSSLLFVPKK